MRIAVAQTPGVRLEDWGETLTLIDRLVAQSAKSDAALVVLPECVWPAYILGSAAAYRAARAAGLPAPREFLGHLRQSAMANHIAICAGYIEEIGARLYNAAALFDATGAILGTHRKCFLWGCDREYFTAGDRLAPFNTPFGRVGLLLCADARLPETAATLAARGAELILQPTAWVNAGAPERPWNPQPDFLIPARAAEFGVPIASASKWGIEGDTTFVGQSLIADPTGRVVAQCGPAETTVVVADITPTPPHPIAITNGVRTTLLDTTAPTMPCPDVGCLDVVFVPEKANARTAAAELASIDDADRPTLVVSVSPVVLAAAPHRVHLTGPRPVPLQFGNIRIASFDAAAAAGFAPARSAALHGGHVAVFFGPARDYFLRARASENRIYVVCADGAECRIFDPSGHRVPTASGLSSRPKQSPQGVWLLAHVTLDLRNTVHKDVAENTNVITGRNPRVYCF